MFQYGFDRGSFLDRRDYYTISTFSEVPDREQDQQLTEPPAPQKKKLDRVFWISGRTPEKRSRRTPKSATATNTETRRE
jgi:hypothetical protein